MLLYLDCANGISGDRLVAALLDLSGARPGARGPLDKVVRPVLKAAGIDPRLAAVEAVRRDGVAALVFRVADAPGFASFDELIMSMYASTVAQPLADVVAAVADRLRAAEHVVHGEADERRHEPCGVTTAVELIAAAALVHDLAPERIVASPPALGPTAASSAGGEASASAAVVLQLLHGVPVADEPGGDASEAGERVGNGDDEGADEAAGEEAAAREVADDGDRARGAGAAAEVTTPTGAALLAHFADDFGAPPAGTVDGEGLGAARRGQPGRPDVLRVVLITPAEEGVDGGPSPESPSGEAESLPAADASSIAADVSAAGAESRADAADVPAPEVEPPADPVPAADGEPSTDGPPPSDAAAWFGVTPEALAEPSADHESPSDTDRLWAASPLFGAAIASRTLAPDGEGTAVADAAPWFKAPAIALPGGDDDAARDDEADAAADDLFLTDADVPPDGPRDADPPGGADAGTEPDAGDALADDGPGDGPDEPEDDAADDAGDEGPDEAGDDVADDTGDEEPLDDVAGLDGCDDAGDDEDTLVGDTHADAGGGQRAETGAAPDDVTATSSALPPAEHVVLETNIDDMSPELLAHAAEALREAGALDVWMTPALMKKGRPGTVLHVLAAANERERLAGVIFAETTTFGLRVLPVGRLYAEERRETVRIAGHDIGVRLGYAQGRLATVSPEYEDCRRAAAELGRPVRVVYEAAQARARSRFSAS
jgi:uncharacterized protein (DUF111 family)